MRPRSPGILLVSATVFGSVVLGSVVLSGCSDDAPQNAAGGTPSTSFSFPKTTPERSSGAAPSSAPSSAGNSGNSGSSGGSGGGAANGGTGSASRDLAFSIAIPAPCGPKTVPTAHGPQCYRLGEELLSAPLVSNVSTTADPAGGGRWAIRLTLVSKYQEAFGEITRKHIGKQLAITFQGKVLSAPRIAGEISGGAIQISGNFTRKQAEDLAGALRG